MRQKIRLLIDGVRLTLALFIFKFFNLNTNFGLLALINIFIITKGRVNTLLSKIISLSNTKTVIPYDSKIFKFNKISDINNYVEQLDKKGYIIFESTLDEDICNKLIDYSLSTKCAQRKMDSEITSTIKNNYFDLNEHNAVRYDYAAQDLINNELIQEIFSDGFLLNIAQNYLGVDPVLDVVSMWWQTNFNKKPDSEAAQFFHYDMDRIRWLKVFVYLTEVNLENGPHCFIEGSHINGGIPEEILKFGYSRIDDSFAENFYSKERFHTFCAPKGTVIIEDTRGLHKGTIVTGSPRLMLQFQYSNSLFGAKYKSAEINDFKAKNARAVNELVPSIFKQYHNEK